jgi:CHAT domain-containing protein
MTLGAFIDRYFDLIAAGLQESTRKTHRTLLDCHLLEEIAGLDLTQTWLTVLSACRSGAGEASVGEGILGLRRGFALAGTEKLLFSLWAVDDEATAHFMDVFYDRLFKSGDPARALNETQVEELRRWTKLEDVPTAVFRAGAFVVTR